MKVLEPKCHVEQYLGKPPMQVTVSYKAANGNGRHLETSIMEQLSEN